MSAKDVNELRKSGKLKEAEKLVKQLLESEPDNIWNKRAASWVIYEYLKIYVTDNTLNYEAFINYLTQLKDLNLSENEKMVFDNAAFQIGKMIFNLLGTSNVDYSKINRIFDIIKDFHFTKPSEGYSFLHKAFIKDYKNWSRYIEFADWWGLKNIRDADYEKEMFNGQENMSLAEKIHIAYPKHLLEGETTDSFAASKKLDIEKIKTFIPQLEEVIQNHPDYKYAIYYKTKLLLAINQKEEALESFIPFLKIKKNDSWVWKLLGEIYSDDIDMRISCYCKALTLKTREDFLIKLRESFADLLIEKGFLSEAKYEIEKAINTRESHNWRLTDRLNNWSKSDWFNTTKTNKSNANFYKEHLVKAEEVIYSNIPQEIIAVEYVNHDKNIINFIKNKSKHGFFNYSNFDIKPEVGDIFKVRFETNTKGNFYRIHHITSTEEPSDAIKFFKGTIKIHPKDFGFVDNIFIEPQLITGGHLQDHEVIFGKAMLSYNKKKDEWGWKAINIDKSEN